MYELVDLIGEEKKQSDDGDQENKRGRTLTEQPPHIMSITK